MFHAQTDLAYRIQLYNLLTEKELEKYNTKSAIQLNHFERTTVGERVFAFSYFMYDTTVYYFINENNYQLSMQVLAPSSSERVQDSAIIIANKVRTILEKRLAKVPQFMFIPQNREVSLSLILR